MYLLTMTQAEPKSDEFDVNIPFFSDACIRCMSLHLIFRGGICQRAPALVLLGTDDAPALKAIYKAGRRGGESTARWRWC